MHDRDTQLLPKHLLESGHSKAGTARERWISRGRIYHLIESGQVEREFAVNTGLQKRTQAPRTLAPYTPLIHERLTAFPAVPSVRLFAE